MPPFQYSEAETPCPAHWNRSRSSFNSFDVYDDNNDDTAAVDFTTELPSVSTLMHQHPRRVKRAATFKIHEDVAVPRGRGIPTAVWRKTTVGKADSSSMLAQPAQRLPVKQRVSFAVGQTSAGSQGKKKAERQSLTSNEHASAAVKKEADTKSGGHELENKEQKDRRRETIYIPPEDTTMPTMFMNIFSPLKTDITVRSDFESLETRIAKRREKQKSPSTAPQRVPLQQPLHIVQESEVKYDIAGSNTGKENVPPGVSPCNDAKREKDCGVFDLPAFKPPPITVAEEVKSRSPQLQRSIEKRPTALQPSCPNSPRTRKSSGLSNKLDALDSLPDKSDGKQTNEAVRQATNGRTQSSGRIFSKQPVKKKTPSKLAVPRISNLDIAQKYPVLEEDISNPSMYEENWLAHQEVVITQLVNSLFDSASGVAVPSDADSLRHELLEAYQDVHFSLLYKRMLASLLYGALRVPKDILHRGNRLKDDIGMRRKFLNLWLNTYDCSALRAAAETVVGRRISIPADAQGQTKNRSKKVLRRSLEAFLDTFLIRNEDASPATKAGKAEHDDAEGSLYCKTLLRSIMIILLLDKARLSPGTSLPRCLFVPSSEYKSSAAVLQALGHMLLPTLGDFLRPLSHLDCQVGYEQHCLQEYEYRIKNLAVDLRDGILLTRLVELLWFPPWQNFTQNEDSNSTATVIMPTGQERPLLQGEDNWPLSQNLKIPCISRATKLFNVQIALSALSGVRGVGIIAQNIRPEDIVDGYREKTIALLWGLLGKWGLPGLLDWDDLKREIIRLKAKLGQVSHHEQSNEDDQEERAQGDDNYEKAMYLLRTWASSLAELKGLRVENMTTSFADGRIFESIVDEYETFINLDDGNGRDMTEEKKHQKSLARKLRGLGCSSQFAPSNGSITHIFDTDFTLGALAFLCSRLLSASKRARTTPQLSPSR
ncbi:hypothetical protein PRK78_003752 [Emydomyces testavorans]|uniref:Calponin-homology (CH) domain-containing protein n=1 Tax=Emydomyces testavorans TaxID=2070801 RepID=A0AAF0DGL1_9EURO|nr:hypothetical protein PRK78_003752 [Emydomyces testavorans]